MKYYTMFLSSICFASSLALSCNELANKKPTPQKPVFHVAKSSPRAVHATPLVALAANIKNLGKEPYDDAFKNKQKADYLKQIDKLLSEPQVDMRGFHEFIEPASPYYVHDIATLYHEKERAYRTHYQLDQEPTVDTSTPKKPTPTYSDIKESIQNLHKQNGQDKTALEDAIINDIKAIEQSGGTLAKLEFEKEAEYGMFLLADSLSSTIQSFRVFKALIEHGGINPNLQTENSNRFCVNKGWTPLMMAVEFSNTDAVRYLLALPNIKINLKNNGGASALSMAAAIVRRKPVEPYLNILKLLLNAGAARADIATYTNTRSLGYSEDIVRLVNG